MGGGYTLLCRQYSSVVAYTTNILGAEPFILWLKFLGYKYIYNICTYPLYIHLTHNITLPVADKVRNTQQIENYVKR